MYEIREVERTEVERSTDRAAAILSCAYVEGALRDFITQRFIPDEKALSEFLGPGAPCGSLVGMARLAHLCGWIGSDVVSDLRRFAEIRNRFAHRSEVDSFDHEAIAEVIDRGFKYLNTSEKINTFLKKATQTRRETYVDAAGEAGGLFIRLSRTARPDPDAPLIGRNAAPSRS